MRLERPPVSKVRCLPGEGGKPGTAAGPRGRRARGWPAQRPASQLGKQCRHRCEDAIAAGSGSSGSPGAVARTAARLHGCRMAISSAAGPAGLFAAWLRHQGVRRRIDGEWLGSPGKPGPAHRRCSPTPGRASENLLRHPVPANAGSDPGRGIRPAPFPGNWP